MASGSGFAHDHVQAAVCPEVANPSTLASMLATIPLGLTNAAMPVGLPGPMRMQWRVVLAGRQVGRRQLHAGGGSQTQPTSRCPPLSPPFPALHRLTTVWINCRSQHAQTDHRRRDSVRLSWEGIGGCFHVCFVLDIKKPTQRLPKQPDASACGR